MLLLAFTAEAHHASGGGGGGLRSLARSEQHDSRDQGKGIAHQKDARSVHIDPASVIDHIDPVPVFII